MPRNPAEALGHAPVDDLLTILLRQFKRVLKDHGIDLSDADMKELAKSVVHQRTLTALGQGIRSALVDIIAESERILAQWNLSFGDSLAATMEDIPGWETTAEFIEIANEKSNAELRISAGSSLAVALGDRQYIPYLHQVIRHDAGTNDIEAVIARRILEFADDGGI